jgi:hypothetical protein
VVTENCYFRLGAPKSFKKKKEALDGFEVLITSVLYPLVELHQDRGIADLVVLSMGP